MALVTYDKLYPLVKPYVEGCPEITIEEHLAEAARDFCVRSEIWRYTTDDDSTIADEELFELDTPSGSLLEDVLSLQVDERELKRVSDKYVHNHELKSGPPTHYSLYQEKYAKLYPIPDATYAVEATVVVKPSLDSVGVEDFIFDHYGRIIAHGAIALIAAIPSKEWSNMDLAMIYRAKFLRETDAVKARDYRKVPMRVMARPFC